MVWVILNGTRYNADKILSYSRIYSHPDLYHGVGVDNYGISLTFEGNSEEVEIYYGINKDEREKDMKKLDDLFDVYSSSSSNSY